MICIAYLDIPLSSFVLAGKKNMSICRKKL